MGEELHFSVDRVFQVLLVIDAEGGVVDVQCDCDRWAENQQRPVNERTCDHIEAVRGWLWAELNDVELEDKLKREVV